MTGPRQKFDRADLCGVGRRLRLLRIGKGWSLKRLADVSGISVAAIRKVELGASNPSLLTVLSLVEALDEPIDRLVAEVRQKGERIRVVRAEEGAKNLAVPVDLSLQIDDASLRGRRIELPAGGPLQAAMPDESGPLFGYVVEGEVVLHCADGRDEICRRGDAFHVFDPARGMVRAAPGRNARLVLLQDVREQATANV